MACRARALYKGRACAYTPPVYYKGSVAFVALPSRGMRAESPREAGADKGVTMPNCNITLPQIERLERAWIRVPGGKSVAERADRIRELNAARKALPAASIADLREVWPAVFPDGGEGIGAHIFYFCSEVSGWQTDRGAREAVVCCLYALAGSARKARAVPSPSPVPVRGRSDGGARLAWRIQAGLNAAILAAAFACGVAFYFKILVPLAGS